APPPSPPVPVVAAVARPCLPQRPYRCVVALGEVVSIRRAAHLGRHILRLEQVLDADGQAVDQRAWVTVPPALRALVGGLARASQVQRRERLDDGFALRDGLEAALQVRARRVRAVPEFRDGVVKGEGPELAWVVALRQGWASLSPPRGLPGRPGPRRH